MSEKNYVINVKTKIGTIFTVRADTAQELASNITDVVANGINDSVAALEEFLLGTTSAPAPVDYVSIVTDTLGGTVISTETTGFAPVPPPVPQQTTVGVRMCGHGPMTARKGIGQKGEWKGLFCPTPKDTPGQCTPVWLKRTDPEWSSI